MRVLITHELFPPEVWRMGEKIAYIVAKNLKKMGIDVKVVTTGDPKIKSFEDIPTVRLPFHRYFMNLAFPWIYKHSKGFDLIQTNNYNACFPSYLAGRVRKIPVVCMVHGMYGKKWIKMRGPFLGTISMLVEKFQISHSFDKVIFLSEFARKEGIKIGIPEKITKVIKPGVDFKKYKLAKKEPFVLFVGRLAKQKGLEYLLSAAKELPEIEFLIVGSGEQGKKLRKTASKNVKFLGFVPEKTLIDLYSKALVFCLPSIGETFGFVILEAMASGCAIVSTVPLDYKGMRVDVGNVKQLKEAIDFLIKNPEIAKKMGRENRKIAKTYKWKDFMNELVKTYEEILNKNR